MSKFNLCLIWIYLTGNGTQIIKCLYRSDSMAFKKRVSYDRETCQLWQHPIDPPRRYMFSEDLLPGGLPLDMTKSPTESKAAFNSISSLDTTLRDRLSHPPKTSRPNPTPTWKSSGLLDWSTKGNNWQTFLLSRNFEELSYLVLAKLGSQFIFCPACQIWITYYQEWREREFLGQCLTFFHKESKLQMGFLYVYHLFWSRLVLPGANVSYCH